MKKIELNINFREYPYKGIINEVASELKISRYAVYYGLNVSPNPRIVKAVHSKVRKVREEISALQEMLGA